MFDILRVKRIASTLQFKMTDELSGVEKKNGKKSYGNDKTSGRGWKSQSVASNRTGVGAAWRKYNGFLQGF
jgi:hypothetical protein